MKALIPDTVLSSEYHSFVSVVVACFNTFKTYTEELKNRLEKGNDLWNNHARMFFISNVLLILTDKVQCHVTPEIGVA